MHVMGSGGACDGEVVVHVMEVTHKHALHKVHIHICSAPSMCCLPSCQVTCL